MGGGSSFIAAFKAYLALSREHPPRQPPNSHHVCLGFLEVLMVSMHLHVGDVGRDT